MNDTTDAYKMNPAEDTLVYGDELKEGMWVLAESPGQRAPDHGTSVKDSLIRAQRFRQVSRLRRTTAPAARDIPERVHFTGTWADGYQATHASDLGQPWIVKKARVDPEAAAAARKVADMCRSAAALGLSPAWTAGPVFETTDGGGAFTVMRDGRAYTVTVTPSAGEG